MRATGCFEGTQPPYNILRNSTTISLMNCELNTTESITDAKCTGTPLTSSWVMATTKWQSWPNSEPRIEGTR